MKKTIFLLLCLLFIISVPCMGQDPEAEPEPEIFSYKSWRYMENETGWTLTEYTGEETAIKIPSNINGKPVTGLGAEIFMNNMKLEQVTIPDSVTEIGNNAFNSCISLRSVKLPGSITKLGNGIFQYCMELEGITLPISLKSIGSNTFAFCRKLTKITIPGRVTSIGSSAFDDCVKLSDIIIQGKVTNVGGNAFRDTPWLENKTDEFVFIGNYVLIKWNGTGSNVQVPHGTYMITDAFAGKYFVENVDLPDSLRKIGENAFKDAVNLKNINIPFKVSSIATSAFEGCRSMVGFKLPDSITSIGGSAFRYCDKLTDLTIPPKVKSIPGSLLADCASLTDVKIPETVTSINKSAFTNSPAVRLRVAYDSEAHHFAEENEIPHIVDLQESNGFIYSRSADGIRIEKYTGLLADVEIPAVINEVPVITIGTAAFQNNKSVRRVTLPITVTRIEDWAFSYMDSLEFIHLSSNLTHLGSNVFAGSTGLTEIILPDSLVEIGESAFEYTRKLAICVKSGTEIENILINSGYQVFPQDYCLDETENLAIWTDLNAAGINGVTYDWRSPISGFEDYKIIQIPEGILAVNETLLANAGNKIFLIIPSSVRGIDKSILRGRSVVILGDAGSEAEAFALENNLRFLVRTRIYMY